MKENFVPGRGNLLNRREILFRGGAAALGLTALTKASPADVLTALWRARRFDLEAAARLASFDPFVGFDPDLEAEAEEVLTHVPLAATCTLTCGLTLGPCYAAAAALTRRDITAGATGLPVRLGFRIIYADTCQPVVGATVDVWHTNASGIYSALTAQVCTTGANVANETWCRGVQSTDGDGIVYFDTVYPGWYSSRTTHIHMTVRVNGTEFVTSQFPFPDRVSDFVYRKHSLYNTRSLRTTNNTNDGVFSSSNLQTFMFETRYKAGQMQVFKTIGIRTSTSQTLCAG